MNIFVRFTWLLFAAVLLLSAAKSVAACSCAGEGLPCQSFGAARAVFVGKVTGAKEQRESRMEDGTKITYDVGEIHFKVEESFLGVKGQTATIFSGTGGGDCGYWFVRGERYLIYAYGDSVDKLYTNICTRTRPLADAEEDLAFLRSLPRKGTGARIFGNVSGAQKDSSSDAWRTAKPLAGITVKIEGKRRTYDAVTDEEGNYELTGLESGKYKVRAVLADYYYEDEYSTREVEVNDRGCVREDFVAHNDSRIAGRVVDEEGRGVAEFNVELIPANSPDTMRLTGLDETWTDEAGRYEIERVAPGRYLLGINITSSPTLKSPYPRTFYPGVTERSQAAVITIGLGQKLTDINIQLPVKLIERTVQGFVVWPDGRPAANVDIYLEDVNRPDRCINDCSAKTDAQGRFTLQGFAGYTYIVQVLADKPTGVAGKTEPFYGQSPVKLINNIVGLRVVINQQGRPWDKEEKTEKAP